eukprot:354579_1
MSTMSSGVLITSGNLYVILGNGYYIMLTSRKIRFTFMFNALFAFAIFSNFFLWSHVNNVSIPQVINESGKPIYFSMTTCLHLDGKSDELNNAIQSILDVHNGSENVMQLIDKFIVMNEYSLKNTTTIIQKLTNKYPFIQIYDKQKHQHGQAYSLNIILSLLRNSKNTIKYWIHWEESWYTTKPFLNHIVNIMESNKRISQLQISTDMWWNEYFIRNVTRSVWKGDYYIILPTNPIEKQLFSFGINNCTQYKDARLKPHWVLNDWPLFSLRPSIMKVNTITNIGDFDNDPKKWPGHFELQFAIRFMCNNLTKAITNHIIATQSKHHKHTYSKYYKRHK